MKSICLTQQAQMHPCGCTVFADWPVRHCGYAVTHLCSDASISLSVYPSQCSTGPATIHSASSVTRALHAGSAAARQAALEAGAVEVALQLLQNNLETRLAFDAADILTALTADESEQLKYDPGSQTLKQLVLVTRDLLHTCDALTDDAPTEQADTTHDGIAASVQLSGIHSEHSGRSELDSIKEDSGGGLLPAAAPYSQALSDTPARAFARSASLKLQAGLAPIMTRPDGQHSEAAMPRTPHLPAPRPSVPQDKDSDCIGNRGGTASTSYSSRSSRDISWLPAGQTGLSFPPSTDRGLSRSQSSGGSWMGGLLKRISSIRSQSSTANTPAADLQRTVSFQQPNVPTLSPFASLTEHSVSPRASYTPTAVQVPPSAALVWTPRKPSCPRHPSHPLLQAVVTALAKVIGGHPSYQAEAQRLGCAGLVLDVLSLGARVGVRGVLAAPAAKLIKSLSEGNAHWQQLLGNAGAVGQLLAILQVRLCTLFGSDVPSSISMRVVCFEACGMHESFVCFGAHWYSTSPM